KTLQLNMPIVPITDIAVQKRDMDLVVATQGRAFYILDDLHVLHQIKDGTAKGDVFLFEPEPAYRTTGAAVRVPPRGTLGENPPAGATVYFYLKDAPKNEVTMEFLDSAGKVVRKYSSRNMVQEAAAPSGDGDEGGGPRGGPAARLMAVAGL